MFDRYLKNPKFYYVAVPLLAAAWAAYAYSVALPQAEQDKKKTIRQYENMQKQITRILEIDPERLSYEQKEGEEEEFDYTMVVEQFAKLWAIPSSNYSIQVSREIRRRNSRTQSATIKIDNIGVEKFSQFFSSLLLRWPDLQCDSLKLAKTKAGPDNWDVTMKMTYVF